MRWYHMVRRCNDPTFPAYATAGALGLTLCKRWHDFDLFAEDIESNFGLPPGYRSQLARKNPNKGWTLSNIEGWTDHEFVANHRRLNAKITYKGRTQSNADWARELGIDASTLWNRIQRGYTPEEAFTKKPNKGIKYR